MRTNKWRISSAALAVIALWITTIHAQTDSPVELQANSSRIVIHKATGKWRAIMAQRDAPVTLPGIGPETPAESAGLDAVLRYGDGFGLKRPDRELKRRGDRRHQRGSRHRFQQVLNDVPVLGGELLVNLDESRRLVSLVGEVSPDLEDSNLSTTPEITAPEAQHTAFAAITKWYGVAQTELSASGPVLTIVDPGLLVTSDSSPEPRLTWQIEVTSRSLLPKSIRELVFVDALRNNTVVLHIDLLMDSLDRRTHDANFNSNLPGPLVCDESDPTCAAGGADAQAAHAFAGDTYDFLLGEHGRDSIDGAGQTLVSTVNWDDFFSCPNAFWTGDQAVFCAGMATDDVVAHEIVHGFTEHTSNLLYYYQSGAINESLSDLWGEFVDLGNGSADDTPVTRWLVGEGSVYGVIRDMDNPPAYGDPDRMSSPLYHTDSSDNGGVHINSGVNNKAVSLMTDGGVFNGYNVTGIGISKVADIYYEAQTSLLVSGSDYADLYEALNQACVNLVGIGGITAGDCDEVRDATDAVEMNTDPAGLNPEAEICPAGLDIGALFFDDIENGTVRWSLANLAGAGTAAWILDTGYTSSGEFMLWGRDSFENTDAVAELNVDVPLPAGDTAYLHFSHAFGFESFGSIDYDGGWIEYSTDGGATWNDAGAMIDDGQDYNATLAANNPHPGQAAFGSESHGYVSTRLDLGSLAGQSVRFRWRISTDELFGGPFGWVLDDVRIYTCGTGLPGNQPPQIQSVGANPSTLSDAEAGSLSVSATDSDGPLGLAYYWSVGPGDGSIIDPYSASATFVPPNVSSQQTVTVTVAVNDGVSTATSTVDVTVQDAGGDVPLIPGVVHLGKYGNNYGSNEHVSEFTVVFYADGIQDLQLSVTGYDIDGNSSEGPMTDEVGVYLNNTLLGYLTIGPNNGLNAGDVFPIIASRQIVGLNTIEFRQKTAGWTWGVTDLLISDLLPSLVLTPGVPDGGSYGNNFGSNQNPTGVLAAFENTGSSFVLSVTGYDVDSTAAGGVPLTDEVSVYLNGLLLGHLSTGPDNGFNGGDSFFIFASDQLPGTNVIEFRVKQSGWTWGVTDLLLEDVSIDATLVIGVPDTGQYGENYGSNQNPDSVAVVFQGSGSNLLLSLNGFDVDDANEVGVFLNGTLVGHLSPGPNNALNGGDLLVLPAALQLPGWNIVEFRQEAGDDTWGITAILAMDTQFDAILTAGVQHGGAWGNNFGSNQNPSSVIAAFQATGTNLELSVTGYDIDSTTAGGVPLIDEVSVLLNGELLGYLSTGPNNGLNGGDSFPILASQQAPGTNVIEFRVKTVGWTWGVTELLIADLVPDAMLSFDVEDPGAYGHNFGSNQNSTRVIAAFQATGTDLALSVTGYDIDSTAAGGVPLIDEVSVLLNGDLLGYLSTGPNNGLNGGDSFPILASQQAPGTNIVEFRVKTVGWTWGVTDLLISQFDPDVMLSFDVEDPGAYGHNYGTNQNPTSVVAAFQSTGQNLTLHVTGYDIDSTAAGGVPLFDEVTVLLNGEVLGYLRSGPNNGHNGGDNFALLASKQHPGTNVIEFRQKTEGWRWGVTDLLVTDFVPDVMLTPGFEDPGAYGHNYGSNQNLTSLITAFENAGADLVLSVTGYDIDSTAAGGVPLIDEVSVLLNGESLGFLSTGPDNGLNGGDSFPIPLSQQAPGTNVIEFREKTPGWKWGVTDLLLLNP